MPRLEHDPWCTKHYDGENICSTKMHEFGPLISAWPDGEPAAVGGISGERRGSEEIQIFIEYRSPSGLMDVNALRSVREAVLESPAAFLAAMDELIAALGEDVPGELVATPELTSTEV